MQEAHKPKMTEQQKQAINHKDGPMMVIAGPGSGKTMVLTHRVQKLLQYAEPEEILVITFARKAAEEMRRRFAALAGEEVAKRAEFGTFHAIFYRWLRRWKVLDESIQILDEDGQKKLWQELGWDVQEVSALFMCSRDASAQYQAEKKKRGLVDFEDLMILMQQEIKHHVVWKQYRYILIDEFQDINPQQYEIVQQMLNPSQQNLFVVGDEDQAIYAFRGADPGIFLRFPKDFPDCQKVELTMNFRCQAEVVQASKRLIRHNQMRFDKNIQAAKPEEGPVQVYQAFDDKKEAMLIRDEVLLWHRRKGYALEEMAVLCRTQAQLKRISAALEEAGVPYVCKQEPETDREAEELLIGRDLEQFWRLGRDPADREAFRKVKKVLPALQGAGSWRRVEEGAAVIEGLLEQDLAPEKRRELTELAKRLRRGVKMPKRWAFAYWLLQTEYVSYAYRKGKSRGLSKYRIWKQMQQMLWPEKGGVFLSTMHGAKGLEFDWVWVAGLAEGQCPRKEALAEGNLEEERRLLYVAMTRAKRQLCLSYYDGLMMEPSRFLKELQEENEEKTP